ncbi:hypothetical protein GBAR_LOCUS2185 [Geodia barretti]|uniref:Uncharacterized protein n=1 Tax=Geodia barretti TaxID=519541 RepID=A0AA35W6H0_GEOBA|nr:hypothetical protein GBAR_LOCUS2185 [Geodia barretti]
MPRLGTATCLPSITCASTSSADNWGWNLPASRSPYYRLNPRTKEKRIPANLAGESPPAQAPDHPDPGSTGSAQHIVGRHSFSVVTSVVWKTSSSAVMRVVQPVGARVIQPVGARLVTIAPRFATAGGGAASTGGSLAGSSAARIAIGSFSVVGIVIGPALAAWTVTSEIRKIRRARRDLGNVLSQQNRELAGFRVRGRRLESLYAEATDLKVEPRALVGSVR